MSQFTCTRSEIWYPVSRSDSLRKHAFPEQRQGVYIGLIGMKVGGARRVQLPALSRVGWGPIQGIPDEFGHILGSFRPFHESPPILIRSHRT